MTPVARAWCASIAIAFLAVARPAHAYIDPGSGSLVFQMLVAGLLSLAFVLRSYWQRLRFRLRQFFSRGATDDGDAAP